MIKITNLDSLEIVLLRLLLIRNSIETLLRVGQKSTDFFGISIMIRYLILELDNFVDSQNALMNELNEKQKKFVLCLTPYLEEINRNKEAIKQLRNNWIAHVQTKGHFNEDIMDLIKRMNFSTAPQDTIIMAKCSIDYVDALKIILVKEFDRASEKNNEGRDDAIQSFITDKNMTNQIIQQKKELTKKRLSLKGFPGVF